MRKWFTMQAAEGVGEILIYDEIGKSFWDDESFTAKQFLATLDGLGDVNEITLRINSPGGDVFDGLAIHNALKNHKANVTAHIDGIAASIASYIAMAANKIIMPANAFMLVHQSRGFAMGTAEDMLTLAADLARIDDSVAATYVARTGMALADLKALMKKDRLMDAKEAKDLGFADELVKETKMAANFSLRLLPKAAAERFRAQLGTGKQCDPPQSASPEGSEPKQLVAAASIPPTKAADVIELNNQKQLGIDEHKAYVASITDLCTLARAPEKVGGYVRASKSIDDVRKELLLAATTQVGVLPQHPLAAHDGNGATNAPITAWAKITDKLNARSTRKE